MQQPSVKPVVLFLCFAAAAGAGAAAWAGDPVRVSVNVIGGNPSGACYGPSVSADGRFVAFYSDADDLVEGADTLDRNDVFVRDIQTGAITRISSAADGSPGDSGSSDPSISEDGRWVAFVSSATNLVEDDTNGRSDIFVHDRATGVTRRVSVSSDGAEAAHNSRAPRISGNGRYVAFDSEAANLVDDDTNDRNDVFRHDLKTGKTVRVSVGPDGEGVDDACEPQVSRKGRHVTFNAAANTFGGDDGTSVVHLRDMKTKKVVIASRTSDGGLPDSGISAHSISGKGRSIVFATSATNMLETPYEDGRSQAYLRTVKSGEVRLLSANAQGAPGNGHSYNTVISADGKYVAFDSRADDLPSDIAADEESVYRADARTGVLVLASRTAGGAAANDVSYEPAISAKGDFVAFISVATDLAPNDTSTDDIYVIELDAGPAAK